MGVTLRFKPIPCGGRSNSVYAADVESDRVVCVSNHFGMVAMNEEGRWDVGWNGIRGEFPHKSLMDALRHWYFKWHQEAAR
jgi:hypothetical protein